MCATDNSNMVHWTNTALSAHIAYMYPRGKGVLPYMGYVFYTVPNGVVFQPFWS